MLEVDVLSAPLPDPTDPPASSPTEGPQPAAPTTIAATNENEQGERKGIWQR
jgi:hypothetical protein